MTSFVKQMQLIALNMINAEKPMMVQFGTVVSASPLKVKISQKLILSKDFFYALDGKTSFSAGDTLVLLRDHGGQKYLILGKKGEL